ncbi:MAG: response regulator transcription factor [Thermodesulfobacteriota bacterium]|nr:response regulator transcription factor [Thermodesulfobacteriota bacterium]
MNQNIAVIDDEPDILHLLSLNLKKAAFEVDTFANAGSFMASLRHTLPDLIILDLMLPDEDGFDVCRELKADPRFESIPIIMLTARVHEADKVSGLELGADDYITKPFSPRELVARVKAVLRRGRGQSREYIRIDDIINIDVQRYQVSVKDRQIKLTPVEFKILHLLASHRGRVFSRDKILDHLWGNEKAVIDRTVDVHIKNLRDKLQEAGSLILNIRGVGYKIEE